MTKTPVVFRHPDDDPLKDRRAIDDASRRKMVMLLVGGVLICGFVLGGVSSAVVMAMANGNEEGTSIEVLPTLAMLPSATMTLAITAEGTPVVESTEFVEVTAEVTAFVPVGELSANAMTATAWATETPVPPEVSGDNPYTVSGGPSSGVVGGGGGNIRVVTSVPQVIVRTVLAPPQIVTRQVIQPVPIVITATYTHTPGITVTVGAEETEEATAEVTETIEPTWTPTFTPTSTETPTEIIYPTDIPTAIPVEGLYSTVEGIVEYPPLAVDSIDDALEAIWPPESTAEVDLSEFVEISG